MCSRRQPARVCLGDGGILGIGRSEAAREPPISREPCFLSILMPADNDAPIATGFKGDDGALRFKIVVWYFSQRNGMIHPGDLGMDFPIARIKPDPTDDNRICLKGHVHQEAL